MDDKMKRRPNEISISRVKTIMKSSPDVENVSQESVYLVAKATELFIKHMVEEAHDISGKAKSIEYKHVSELVQTEDTLAFLREIVPRKFSLREVKELRLERGINSENQDTSDLSDISQESHLASPPPGPSSSAPSQKHAPVKDLPSSKQSSKDGPGLSALSSALPAAPKTSTQKRSANGSEVSSTETSSYAANESSPSPSKKTNVHSPVTIEDDTDDDIMEVPTTQTNEENKETLMESAPSPTSDSMSSETCTPSPSPSYSSLSPEPHLIQVDVVSSNSSE